MSRLHRSSQRLFCVSALTLMSGWVSGCGDLTTERQVRLRLGEDSGRAAINLQKVLLGAPESRGWSAVSFGACDAIDPPEIRDLEFSVTSDADPNPTFFPVAQSSDGLGRVGISTRALMGAAADSGLDVLASGSAAPEFNLVVPDGFPSGTDYRVRAFGVVRYNNGGGTTCSNVDENDQSENTALHLVLGEAGGVTIADQGPTDANLQLTVSKDPVGLSANPPASATLSPFSAVGFTVNGLTAAPTTLTLRAMWTSLGSARRVGGGVSPDNTARSAFKAYPQYLYPVFPYRGARMGFDAVDVSTRKSAELLVPEGLQSGSTASAGALSFSAVSP